MAETRHVSYWACSDQLLNFIKVKIKSEVWCEPTSILITFAYKNTVNRGKESSKGTKEIRYRSHPWLWGKSPDTSVESTSHNGLKPVTSLDSEEAVMPSWGRDRWMVRGRGMRMAVYAAIRMGLLLWYPRSLIIIMKNINSWHFNHNSSKLLVNEAQLSLISIKLRVFKEIN